MACPSWCPCDPTAQVGLDVNPPQRSTEARQGQLAALRIRHTALWLIDALRLARHVRVAHPLAAAEAPIEYTDVTDPICGDEPPDVFQGHAGRCILMRGHTARGIDHLWRDRHRPHREVWTWQ